MQIQRLETILADSEQGLGSAASNINSLKEQSEKLRAELEQNRLELRTAKSRSAALEVSAVIGLTLLSRRPHYQKVRKYSRSQWGTFLKL